MSAHRTFVVGQIGLAVGVLIAIALHPGFVLKWDEGGVSNYGVHAETVVFYTGGFLAAICGAWVAARRCVGPDRYRLARTLRVYSIVMVMNLISTYPYPLSSTWRDVHFTFGVVLFVAIFGALLEFTATLGRVRRAFVVALLGELIGALTWAGVVTMLFAAQAVVGIGFAVLGYEVLGDSSQLMGEAVSLF